MNINKEKLLAYLISIAPKDSPKWFIPTGISERPERPSFVGVGTRNNILLCFNEAEIPENTSEQHRNNIIEYRRILSAIRKWEQNFDQQVFIQWPVYWANETLKAIEKVGQIDSTAGASK